MKNTTLNTKVLSERDSLAKAKLENFFEAYNVFDLYYMNLQKYIKKMENGYVISAKPEETESLYLTYELAKKSYNTVARKFNEFKEIFKEGGYEDFKATHLKRTELIVLDYLAQKRPPTSACLLELYGKSLREIGIVLTEDKAD